MGGTTFKIKGKGASMNETYSDAVERAIYEYGNDPYNGTISTTHSIIDKTSFFKNSGKNLNNFIEDILKNASKRHCFGICIKEPKKNTNKIKSQVINKPFKGTRKWELVYVVTEGLFDVNVIGSKDNKADAIKLARLHTEKTQRKTFIHIERKLKGSNSQVAEIVYKSSNNESLGEYILFGIAAE